MAREDCFDRIAAKTGRTRAEVEAELSGLDDRAQTYEQRGVPSREALTRASNERIDEHAREAFGRRRRIMMDMMATAERTRWYKQRLAEGHSAELIMTARLDGVNTPMEGGRKSVGAVRGLLTEKYGGAFNLEMEKAGLDKLFASGTITNDWVRELHELNKPAYYDAERGLVGEPSAGGTGVTGNKQALQIAKIIRQYQKASMADLNAAGGSVGSYSGYITRTSHDPNLLRKAADKNAPGKGGRDVDREAWIDKTLPKLDVKRTFGQMPATAVRDVMRSIWRELSTGQFGEPQAKDDTTYGNLARKVSEHRELHFKSAGDWLAYNKDFGVRPPESQVIHAFENTARQVALLRGFGSKPREGFESDIAFLKSEIQNDPAALDRFNQKESGLRNLFNQFDYADNAPAGEWLRRGTAITMAVNRWSKLGRVPFTHVASIFTKAIAGKAIGASLGERFGGLFSDVIRGAPGSDKREVADLMLAGSNAIMGHDLSRYETADQLPGTMAKIDTWFAKYTGLTAMVENNRRGFEVMAARHMGALFDKDGEARKWEEVPELERRELNRYGFGEPEWNAMQKVAWHQDSEGRRYLLPTDAQRLTDADVRSLIEERQTISQRAMPVTAQAIARAREDLADTLHAFYWDQGRYAIFEPSARARALMFQGLATTSPNWYQAAKLFWQFRVWHMENFYRTWGRMIYGGGSTGEKVAGIAELVAGSALMGVFAEGLRELVQGQNPIERLKSHPWEYLTRGFLRSGAGTMAGDYLFGEYDRHGLSIWSNLLGPTFGQAEKVMNLKGDLWNAVQAQYQGSSSAGRKWRQFGTETAYAARPNLPFVDMWWTFKAFDYLIFYRVLEALNPGFLERMQNRMEKKQGVKFLLSPQKAAGGGLSRF